MGSFPGHALPGSFFIIFGIWYIIRLFQMYYSSRQRNAQFKSKIAMDCSFCCGRLKNLPLEASVKLFFTSVGIFIEIYSGFVNKEFVSPGNGQHATMFFFFGLTGVCDILKHYGAPLPPDLDYLTYALALGIEGLLFKFHLHGRTDLDILVHTLLLYIIFLGMIAVFVEMYFRRNVLAALVRSYFLLLQGTWFWQLGFILYSPFKDAIPWNQEDHKDMTIATLYFTWHCGIDLVILLLIGAGIACCYGRRNGGFDDHDEMSMKRLIQTGANGQTVVSLNDDSDSDVEFQKPALK